jgi:hypothetical protein
MPPPRPNDGEVLRSQRSHNTTTGRTPQHNIKTLKGIQLHMITSNKTSPMSPRTIARHHMDHDHWV